MSTPTFLPRIWFFVGIASIVSVLIFIAYMVTPSFFIEADRHYFVGLDILSVSTHTCVPDASLDECIRQGFLEAVAADPNPAHWLPMKLTFLP